MVKPQGKDVRAFSLIITHLNIYIHPATIHNLGHKEKLRIWVNNDIVIYIFKDLNIKPENKRSSLY